MPETDDFEKARYEYCVQQFDRQLKRFFELDSKGRIYLVVITVLLSGIVLNFSLLEMLSQFLVSRELPVHLLYIIGILTTFSAIFIFDALFAVMKAITLKKYKNEFPDKIVSALFISSEYLDDHHVNTLYKTAAYGYATSFEELQKACAEKVEWIDRCSWDIFASTSLLTILAVVLFIVELS